MLYISKNTPNHGNPMSRPFPDCIELPESLLSEYLAARGFCDIEIDENGTATALTANREALEAYLAAFPDVDPEMPISVEDLQSENKRLKEQVAALSTQADFHEECLVEMASIVYA